MAKDTIAINGVPIQPMGMNDNNPLESELNWYQTRGVQSLSELCLQRCNGKLLINKFDSPILAIHGGLHESVFVETANALYIFEHITDAIPVVTSPLDYDAEPTTYEWQEINPDNGGDGIQLLTLAGIDDARELISSIGFNFPFYGQVYTGIYVNVNGYIEFADNPNYYYESGPFPTSGFNGMFPPLILLLASDILTTTRGKIFYRLETNQIRIQWDDLMHYGVPSSHYTFQALLKNTGEIIFYYNHMAVFNQGGYWWGAAAIQDNLGAHGINLANNASSSSNTFFVDNYAHRFFLI